MDELKYNGEGYYDPTTYEALSKIAKEEYEARKAANYRPLVYVCSPYSGDVEKNTARARSFCWCAVVKRAIPVAPHLLFPQFM